MKFLLGAFAVALGALFGWALLRGAGSVLYERDPRAELPPCFEVGSPFHHRFRAGCSGRMSTPRGPVSLSVNEDGLRELPRARALENSRRVVVIGDSFVEGWWSTLDQSLTTLLARGTEGTYFVNGGLRSTGSLMQAARLHGVLRAYRPAGVIWLVNDTDPLDDRFTCAIARDPSRPAELLELDAPEFGLAGWRMGAVALLGGTAAGGRLRRRFYGENWQRLAGSEAGGRCGACRGVEEMKRVAKEAGVPLLVFHLSLERLLPRGHYYGESAGGGEELRECLRRSGLTVQPVGPPAEMSAEMLANYVWEGDFHFNPEGTAMLAEQMAPAMSRWLATLPASRGAKRGERERGVR